MKSYKFKIEELDCMTKRFKFKCDESNYEEALKQIKKVIKKEESDVYIEEI